MNSLSCISARNTPGKSSNGFLNTTAKPGGNVYLFHSLKPGRTINFDDYRFGGSDGQEADDEIMGTGDINTAEFWQYDSRLGRRWNLDTVDQISMSNYAVFGNNPIFMVDWNGDNADGYTVDKEGNIEWVNNEGGEEFDVLYRKSEYSEDTRGNYGNDVVNGQGLIVSDKNILSNLNKNNQNGFDGSYATTNSRGDAFNVYYFTTNYTEVEWGISGFNKDGKIDYVLTTSHDGDYVMTPTLMQYRNIFGYSLGQQLFDIHSHPNDFSEGASGYKIEGRAYGDRAYYYKKHKELKQNKDKKPAPHYIYNIKRRTLYNYNIKNKDNFIRKISKSSDLYRNLGF